jgi:hypothetical protein
LLVPAWLFAKAVERLQARLEPGPPQAQPAQTQIQQGAFS